MVHDLEFSQVERQVLDGLKVGNEALKKANDMFSIDEIERIMDDTAEAAEKVTRTCINYEQIYTLSCMSVIMQSHFIR